MAEYVNDATQPTYCGAPGWAVITYPWGSWIVGRMLLHAASDLKQRRPIRWGGREYVLEERE